jgi:hypothetical protein
MKAWLKTDLAYAAGFIDGEGCFYLGHRRGGGNRECFPCTFTLSQSTQPVLLDLQRLFGGRVYPSKTHGKGWQPVWMWTIYGAEADRMTRLILPFLRIKKPQAIVFQQMRKLINANRMGRRITGAAMEERLRLVRLIKELKVAA